MKREIINIINITIPATNAIDVKCPLRFFNLLYSFVSVSVSSLSSTIPLVEFTPTAQTKTLLIPLTTIDPAFKKGSPFSSADLLIYLLS